MSEYETTIDAENESTGVLKKGKKKQVSVNLDRNIYDGMRILSQLKAKSVGEIFVDYATVIVKKNSELLRQAAETLQAYNSRVIDNDA